MGNNWNIVTNIDNLKKSPIFHFQIFRIGKSNVIEVHRLKNKKDRFCFTTLGNWPMDNNHSMATMIHSHFTLHMMSPWTLLMFFLQIQTGLFTKFCVWTCPFNTFNFLMHNKLLLNMNFIIILLLYYVIVGKDKMSLFWWKNQPHLIKTIILAPFLICSEKRLWRGKLQKWTYYCLSK